MAVVFTTIGGIGPPEATDWIDGLFAASYVSERLAGGTGYQTSMRKSRLYRVAARLLYSRLVRDG